MAGINFTTSSQPVSSGTFNGGLNSTAGPLTVQPNEASDLQNIDFDKFGSILKRNGYRVASDDSVVGSNQSDGLHWYEFVDDNGTTIRYALNVSGGKIYYMNNLDGIWMDITGSFVLTPGYHCDFENYNNIMFGTNGVDLTFQWNGTGNVIAVPAFTSNSFTFKVYGITTAPAVGDTYTTGIYSFTVANGIYIFTTSGVSVAPAPGATYTNNSITFTVISATTSTIIAWANGIPSASGTLTKSNSSAGDVTITFSAYSNNVSGNLYTFTVSGTSTLPTVGAVYNNNTDSYGNPVSFTVLSSNSTYVVTLANSNPTASGYITKSSGTGDNSIKFSTYSATSQVNFYGFVTASVSSYPEAGSTYTNNGVTFRVISTATNFIMTGATGKPEDSGTLTFVTGTGDTTISFTSYNNSRISIPAYYSCTFSVSELSTVPLMGATYTNNSSTFTITSATNSTIVAWATGLPSAVGYGTLTKVTGTGDTTIAFSSYSYENVPAVLGSTYTNNGITYTVISSTATGLSASGTGLPNRYGVLTKASGTGYANIIFSSFSTTIEPITFTITYVDVSGDANNLGGSIIATATSIPEQTATIYRTSGTGDTSISYTNATANVNLKSAKFVKAFNNYLFWGNVVVESTKTVDGVTTTTTDIHTTRVYWSNIKDPTSIAGDSWLEVGLKDGQEITGLRVLADRLVVYKERSIYNIYYTGDTDIPFIMPGGGKSTSNVGCIAPFSIQEVNNGHVFLAPDGIYYYDGSGSTKLSYRISNTLQSFNADHFKDAVSTVYKAKNKYMLSFFSASNTTANRIVVWDYFNNAFSVYVGMNASAMDTFFVDGYTETPYFADYSGYTYQMEFGANDNPLGVETAIDSYFYTNWVAFSDLCDQKGIPSVYIYYQTSNSVLTFAYSYDFEYNDQYIQTISLATATDVYGIGVYGTATYAGTGGAVIRRDLTGRGRVVRFKLANNAIDEQFRIDGIGALTHLETNV